MIFDEAVRCLEAGEIIRRPVGPQQFKVFRLFKSPPRYGMRYEWEGHANDPWNPGCFEREDVVATDWVAGDGRREDDRPSAGTGR